MKTITIFLILLTACTAYANNFVPRTLSQQNALADAIYKAEGGKETRYPFGIRSVRCSGYEDCRVVCLNTIKNNIKRWEKSVNQGDDRDYLTFLWHRYAPPKSHHLNNHWLTNVLYFLNKST